MEVIEVEAKIENVIPITAKVEEIVENHGCPDIDRINIDVAIDELFSNIVYYGYKDEVGLVWIEVESLEDPKGVELTLIDCAVPYNPLDKDDPNIDLPPEEREIGGLGIFMVKESMDEVDYEYKDGKNRLRLVKYWGEV